MKNNCFRIKQNLSLSSSHQESSLKKGFGLLYHGHGFVKGLFQVVFYIAASLAAFYDTYLWD